VQIGLPIKEDHFFDNTKVYDVRYANLFDGDMTYSFIGFNTSITVGLRRDLKIISNVQIQGKTFRHGQLIRLIPLRQNGNHTHIHTHSYICRFIQHKILR
jgi:hypothetical protein